MGDKAVSVSFNTGKDVLNAYWGYLSNGGLVIRDPSGLSEGDAVALDVTIESMQLRYQLRGHVVRRPNLDAHDHAVIAFAPGEPHDLLLSAAWSDTDKVPARKHRRQPTQAPVRVRAGEDLLDGRMVNVSRGGCCVRVRTAAPHRVATGSDVAIMTDDGEIPGRVRWARAADFGIEFERPDGEAVEAFLARLP